MDENGRYSCRFDGCHKTFAYNGKSRKDHGASHDPPVVVTTELLTSATPQMMEEAHQTMSVLHGMDCFAKNCMMQFRKVMVEEFSHAGSFCWCISEQMVKEAPNMLWKHFTTVANC